MLGIATPTHANMIYSWDGGGSTDLWNDGFNWSANNVPPSSIDTELIFAGTVRLTPQFTSNFTLNTLNFAANAGAFTIGGSGTLNFQANSNNLLPSLVQASVANQTINNKISLTNSLGVYSLSTGTLTLNGVISGAASLVKQGLGNLILTAANTFSGGMFVSAGTLTLDFNATTAPTSNIILAANPLQMNGSAFVMQGSNKPSTNVSQTFSGLNIVPGSNTISVSAGTGGTATLILGNIMRSVGGTVTFLPSANAVITTTATNTLGILGGYALYAGSDWATVSGGQIARYTAYTNNSWAAANNTSITSSASIPANSTTNSLRFGAPGAFTLTLSGTNTIASGGLLVSSAVGSNLTQINGGSLTGASSADLIIHQNNTAGGLTIGSSIVNNGGATSLTKSGPGLLTLTGASTFTGVLRVYEGTLTFASGSSWNNPAADGIPQAAVVRGGATLNINGSINLTNQEMDVSTTVSTPAIVNLNSGGTLTTATTAVGYTGTGIFNQTGGTHNTGFLRMSAAYTGGSMPVSNGTYSMSGGQFNVGGMIIGDQAPAAFNHTGGTVAVTNGIELGSGSTYSLSGPSSSLTASNIRLGGYRGLGTFTQTDGAVTIAGELPYAGYLSVGDANGGVYNLNGGTLSTAETDLGYEGAGVINQNGGTHTIINAGTLYMGFYGGSSGTYNLNGGTIQLGNIAGADGVSTFNFKGGTLKAAADQPTFVTGLTNANVQTGGARIDSNGHTIMIDQPLLHDAALGATSDGGLTKQGAGALTLSGVSTYTGPTAVNAGKLFVNGSLGSSATPTGTVTVANNGSILAGDGVIHGPVTVGGGISPGASDNSTAVLETGSLTLQRNSFFYVDLNSPIAGSGYDQLSVTGSVLNGGAHLTLTAGFGLQMGQIFYILLNDGSDAITGKFFGLQTEGQTFQSGGYDFQISYFANGDSGSVGNDISLTVVPVPEATTWIGGLLSLLAVAYTQRRRFLLRVQ